MAKPCMYCGEACGIEARVWECHYRPRRQSSYWGVFSVDLCDFCYNLALKQLPQDSYVVGRDWWDAVDCVCCYIDEEIKGAKAEYWRRRLSP